MSTVRKGGLIFGRMVLLGMSLIIFCDSGVGTRGARGARGATGPPNISTGGLAPSPNNQDTVYIISVLRTYNLNRSMSHLAYNL